MMGGRRGDRDTWQETITFAVEGIQSFSASRKNFLHINPPLF